MAKWEKVFDNKIGNKMSKTEQVRHDKTLNAAIRSLAGKEVDLKKEGDNAFLEKKTKEESLIQAYESKKLKSKALIKEAKRLSAELEKKNKTKKEDKPNENS